MVIVEGVSTPESIQDEGTLTCGVKFDVVGFGFRNPTNNEIEGFDADICREIAAELGVEAELIEAVSANRIPFLNERRVDLVISTFTINDERRTQIDFSRPYYVARGRILVPEGSDIAGVDDLGGTRVCTALGSTYEATLTEQIEAIAVKLYGASGVDLLPQALKDLDRIAELGMDRAPVCMAKTHLSLSHEPGLRNRPAGFRVPIRGLVPSTGAGFVVALCGDMQRMPGLGRTPAFMNIDLDQDGNTVGLF